jgi:hypothetical protein
VSPIPQPAQSAPRFIRLSLTIKNLSENNNIASWNRFKL